MEWESNNPKSLLEICTEFCVDHVSAFCDYCSKKAEYSLRHGIILSAQICERLMEAFCAKQDTDTYLGIFKDCDRTKLRRLILRGSPLGVSEETIRSLLRHNLSELDITGCPSVKALDVIHDINAHSQNLTSLYISQYQLFQEVSMHSLASVHPCGSHDEENERQSGDEFGVDYIFKCPKLKALGIHGLHEMQCKEKDIIRVTIKLTKNLTLLDLSYCQIEFELMNCVIDLQNLLSLVLYEVSIKNINKAFNIIAKLKKLRALDLSQGQPRPVEYVESTDSLGFLMSQLPNLEWLDLSGTNLAGRLKDEQRSDRMFPKSPSCGDGTEANKKQCSIPGLESTTLQFLGLLGCSYDACARKDIPAVKVTGDANEDQIIYAMLVYVEKVELLIKALNRFFRVYRFDDCKDQRGALEGILNAMNRWPADKRVQICCSDLLYYFVKGEKKHNLNTNLKKKIIKAIITGMQQHPDEVDIMKLGCITITSLGIPHDVFLNEDLITIVVKMLAPARADIDKWMQLAGIFLLDSLACTEKQLLGDLGAISTILDIIRYQLSQNVCDVVMGEAWITLLSITDESAINCERFINEGGMQIYHISLQKFPDKKGLLSGMMLVLNNVAKFPYLRRRLMQYGPVEGLSFELFKDNPGEMTVNEAKDKGEEAQ